MRAIVILLAAISVAIVASLDATAQPRTARAGAVQEAEICQTGNGPAPEPAASTDLSAELPAGLDLTVLADAATERMPRYHDNLVLTLRQLTIAPGAVTDVRQADGPIVFYVAAGDVGISINGRMEARQPQSATLVETGQYYALQGDGTGPGAVWRVALVPSALETTVGRGEIAQVVDGGDEISITADSVESRLMMTANVPAMTGPGRLFLACLRWGDLAADLGEIAFQGPVALLVFDGQLLIGESGKLEAGSCVAFPAQSPRRLRPGDPTPTLLVFGALPADGPLWLSVAGSPAASQAPMPIEFSCGDESAPEPAAAALRPFAPAFPQQL